MEYLSQPFKLNSSGLESTITISLRLVFMKVWDGDNKIKEDESVMHIVRVWLVKLAGRLGGSKAGNKPEQTRPIVS